MNGIKKPQITGYTKLEVLGKPFVDTYITEDYKESVQMVLNNALRNHETANYEVPIYTKSGNRIMVLLNATTRRNITGEVTGVVGVGQDITELDSARNNLVIQNNRFNNIERFNCSFLGKSI